MKDDSFISRISEMIARQNPEVAKLLDYGAKVKYSLERQIKESRQRIEEEKKLRRWNYYIEFCEIFEKTPTASRKKLIEFNEGLIEKKIIECKINKDDFGQQENEELLSTIRAFYSLISKIPYSAKEDINKGIEKRSFLLKSSISAEAINNLRKSLITAGFIRKETSAVEFRSAFTESTNIKKVDWNKKGVLKYFVEQLLLKESIFLEKPKEQWKIVESNYTVNGKDLDASKFRKVSPTSSIEIRDKIDQALENFLRQ